MDSSIRISADLCVLTTPRSFSQLTTSFFGSQCQGIHSALFSALPFVLFLVLLRIFASNYCSFYPTYISSLYVVLFGSVSSDPQ